MRNMEKQLKNKLNFFMDMPIKSYNYTSFMGGVLFADSQLWKPYYLTKHILIVCNDLFDVICDDMIMYQDKDVFERKMFNFKVRDVNELKNDIISKIDEGFYASVTVDEMYIPHRTAFNDYSFYHDLLIYGYDLEKNIFYTAGYDDTGYFSCLEHDIDIVTSSILSCLKGRKSKPHSHYFRARSEYKEFSKESVKNSLEKYLSSEPMIRKKYNGSYGISAYEKLVERQISAIETGEELRRATFSMLVEHKKIMLERVKYLNEYCGEIDTKTIDMFDKTLELAKVIQSCSIKYEITKNQKIGMSMVGYIKELAELEETAIRKLLKQL